jgi:hypothetical protein
MTGLAKHAGAAGFLGSMESPASRGGAPLSLACASRVMYLQNSALQAGKEPSHKASNGKAKCKVVFKK